MVRETGCGAELYGKYGTGADRGERSPKPERNRKESRSGVPFLRGLCRRRKPQRAGAHGAPQDGDFRPSGIVSFEGFRYNEIIRTVKKQRK